eukprot:5771846-Pleurochrysis_carterae.AAC.1
MHRVPACVRTSKRALSSLITDALLLTSARVCASARGLRVRVIFASAHVCVRVCMQPRAATRATASTANLPCDSSTRRAATASRRRRSQERRTHARARARARLDARTHACTIARAHSHC